MTTKYRLPCDCGRTLCVSTTQAGETVHCECGADLTVPSLRALSNLEPASPSPSTRKRRRRSWTKRRGWIFLGAILTAAALSLAALVEWTRPRMADVEALRPIEVWTIWQDVRRGPERNLTAMEQRFLEQLGIRRVWQTGLLAAAAAGVVLMAIAYALPEPRSPRSPRRARSIASADRSPTNPPETA